MNIVQFRNNFIWQEESGLEKFMTILHFGLKVSLINLEVVMNCNVNDYYKDLMNMPKRCFSNK